MADLRIFENIQKHITLNAEEISYLNTQFVVKTLRRKELLLTQGQICHKLFFVEEGSCRAFHLNEDGKESTIMFALQDWWITDMNCFINTKSAQLSIEALEDSKIIGISLYLLQACFKKIPKFERLFRILFQNAYIREQQRALHYLSKSTQDRYWQFQAQYPALAKKVTQKQIASYLGVTPEFLSIIKKK